MERREQAPRAAWRELVAAQGFLWHTTDGGVPYWDESAHYVFTPSEIDVLEHATNELHMLCLGVVAHVIEHRLYETLCIPPAAVPLIEASWRARAPSIYGRFDLAFDGTHPPKLLEYNADTPTSLVEAAVVQWHWLRATWPGCDQFSAIHDRLIDAWRAHLGRGASQDLFFASGRSPEDLLTCTYLAQTAAQAGFLRIHQQPIDDIGWDEPTAHFVDPTGRPIERVFKLYPWEWLIDEPFAAHIAAATWIEPAWKMVLSNKGILPILWQLHPGHPNLLEAHRLGPDAPPPPSTGWVRKPLFSREGANIELHATDGRIYTTDGTYGAEGTLWQADAQLPCFDGRTPVIGSWVVGGASAGIGIRESSSPITDDTSRFVPHLIR